MPFNVIASTITDLFSCFNQSYSMAFLFIFNGKVKLDIIELYFQRFGRFILWQISLFVNITGNKEGYKGNGKEHCKT